MHLGICGQRKLINALEQSGQARGLVAGGNADCE